MENPNISVIVPLYNAKDYIGKCLDSLLAQTFQNFEVIVVNDCSIDKSAKIVENYKDKFGERFKSTATKKNSGGSGYVPRNLGLGLALGEYVFFVDADDFISENALETLYNAAKENDADIVYTAAYYDQNSSKEFQVLSDAKDNDSSKDGVEEKSVLIVDELDKNLNRLFSGEDFRTAWTKFVRRDLLTQNEILFPEIITGGDYIWSMNIYSRAKRFLRLAVPVYFRRSYSVSLISGKPRKPDSKVSFWVSAFVAWLQALNELTNKNDILQKYSAQYYEISSQYFAHCFNRISNEIVNRFFSEETYNILLSKFSEEKALSASAIPFFFSVIANREKDIVKSQKRVKELEDTITRQKKQNETLAVDAKRAKELEIAVTRQKRQISNLTSGIERAKQLEGELNQQKEQIVSLTADAQRAKQLEGELNQQKEQIVSLTADAQRAKQLEGELNQQKEQIAFLSNQASGIAVSVIIPMYNAEQFIGEALDSLFEQTLKNFEVIIVNDCSKDNCCEVVESYIPKFKGRLKLYHMPKNSGAAPAPRNKGFLFSRGEYIFFMDVDDTLTKTALEEMYTLAKEYEADVVYCEKYYMSTGIGQEFINNIHVADKLIQSGGFVDKPTFITDDMAERLQDLKKQRFWVTPWQRLVSRELIAENKITFPEIIGSDDVLWCYTVLCCAKKFLRVPNMCYIRRMSEESFTKSKKAPGRHLHQWMDMIIRGLKFADNFMDRIKFFQENPRYRYEGLLILSRASFNTQTYNVCKDIAPWDLHEIFLTEFTKDTGESNVAVASLLVRIFEQNKTLSKNQQKLKMAENFIIDYQKRIADLEAEVERLKSEKNYLPKIASSEKFIRPKVSVVIPMHNAEKYIGENLDSLLVQTFQEFEVILVDDFSTDKSISIAENYVPKFGGRLKLFKTKNHSGSDSVLKNIGLKLAGGKYVFFMNAYDTLAENALQTLYSAAKEYDTDIVYTSSYYQSEAKNKVVVLNDGKGKKLLKEGLEDTPTLNTEPDKNIQMLIFGKGFTDSWTKFIRRDFLIEDEILFPEIPADGDHIWTINLYCHAKKVLRLTNPVYFYRKHNAEEVSKEKRTPSEQISYEVSSFVDWLKALNELSSENEILRKNPVYANAASKKAFERLLKSLTKELKQSTDKNVYEILYREFNKRNDLSGLTVPFLFGSTNTAKKA